MKEAWLNKEIIKLIEEVVEQLDEASYKLDETIGELEDIAYDDECDEEIQDELHDFCNELTWDYKDVIDSLSSQLYEMIAD